MKFRLYFFTLIFFLISSSINAKPRCDIFYEKIGNVSGDSLNFLNCFEIPVKNLIKLNNKWFKDYLK